MTQGFYEQLGVVVDAAPDELRAAYGHAVSHVLRRREATVLQGGDTASLDLARAQLDEAWRVLSDPGRRRRYDAMLALVNDGVDGLDPEDLWRAAAGALLHPTVAAAAELVDATTHLGLGPLPAAPRPTQGRRREGAAAWPGVPTPARTPAQEFASFGARTAGAPSPAVPAPPTPPPARRAAYGTGLTTPGVMSAPSSSHSAADDVPLAGPATSWTSLPEPARADVPAAPAPARPAAAPASVALPPRPTAAPPRPASAPARPSTSAPASVSVAAPSPPPMVAGEPSPQEIGALMQQHGPSGALLRAVRERRGLDLSTLSNTTRISTSYLAAVESEDYAALPSTPLFVRGYVKNVSRLLQLDVDWMVEGYMRRFGGD